MKNIMLNTILKNNGMTLVEIMVSMVISSLVIAGIYGVYTIQQRSYTVQEQVSEMQQRARVVIALMTSEMRMAGYDPNGSCDDVLRAEEGKIVFDICDPDDSIATEKRVTFQFDSANEAIELFRDTDRDDTPNNVITSINLHPDATAVTEGVNALELLYQDEDGNDLGSPVSDPAQIKLVKISMLIRSSYPDPIYTDSLSYVPASGDTSWDINGSAAGTGNPPNDHYHRRLVIISVQLRNM